MQSFKRSVSGRKTNLSIEISNREDHATNIFTTNDLILGNVILRCDSDTLIDNLCILFNGFTTIIVPNLQPWSPVRAVSSIGHNFLCMRQPIDPTLLPASRIAKAGKTYTIPFKFVVPKKLLTNACEHGKSGNTLMKSKHTLLPPSLGRVNTSDIFHNDLAPESVKITYRLVALAQTRQSASSTPMKIRKELPICVMPRTQEEPPLHISQNDAQYQLRAEQVVRKRLSKLGKTVGKLTAEIKQPCPLQICNLGHNRIESDPSTAIVSVRFEPSRPGEHPPQIFSTQSKLHAYTFVSCVPFDSVPTLEEYREYTPGKTVHCDTVDLTNLDLGDIVWERHMDQTHQPFYTTSIRTPITPSNKSAQKKILVSTFNSCFVCRSYKLEMKVRYRNNTVAKPDVVCNSNEKSSRLPSGTERIVVTASTSHLPSSSAVMTLTTPLQVITSIDRSASISEQASTCDGVTDCGELPEEGGRMIDMTTIQEELGRFNLGEGGREFDPPFELQDNKSEVLPPRYHPIF